MKAVTCLVSVMAGLVLTCGVCLAQLDTASLKKPVTLTVRQVLEMRLQLLAAQLSTKALRIEDMGSLDFPVLIEIAENGTIKFSLRGTFDRSLEQSVQEEILERNMSIVTLLIRSLVREAFPQVKLQSPRDIEGLWYPGEAYYPKATWEGNRLKWIDDHSPRPPEH